MHKQLWGDEVEEEIYLGVRERKRLSITGLEDVDDDADISIETRMAGINF
jgi:hypothetical protein